MALRDLITEEEYNIMEAWRNHTISQTRGNLEKKVPMREILHVWEKSKENLGDMFQGHLILSKPFSVEKTSTMMVDSLKNAVRGSEGALVFWSTLNWLILEVPDMRVEADNEFIFTGFIHHLTSFHAICDGRIDRDVSVFINSRQNHPAQKVVKINKDTHTLKAIHLFYTEVEKFLKKHPDRRPQHITDEQWAERFEKLNKNYEEFRIVCSQATNQRKLKGRLCLSIHPMDFMTMSDNANGWNSCMRWDNGCGDYCMGTVEMMNSSYVCMAYLINEDKSFTFEGGKWNSKMWRELYIVHPNVITNVKAYPYRNDDLTRAVVDWLRDLATQNLHYNYMSKNIIWDDYYFHDADNHEITPTCTYFETGYMYNDFCYYHIMYPHEGWTPEEGFDIYYSGDAQCMICGDYIENDNSDFDESHLFCDDCDGRIVGYCAICGEKIYEADDFLNLANGDIVCVGCREDCAVDAWDTVKNHAEYSEDVLYPKSELRRIKIVLPSNNNTAFRLVGSIYINFNVTKEGFSDTVLTDEKGFLYIDFYEQIWYINALYVKDKIIDIVHQKTIDTIFTDEYPLFYPRWHCSSIKYYYADAALDVPEDMTIDQYIDNVVRYCKLEENPYNQGDTVDLEAIKEEIRKRCFFQHIA